MHESDAAVKVALRIPGQWSHPRELVEALPEGYRLTGDSLLLPDGLSIGFGAVKADDQFAEIFRNSCRQTPTEEERAKIDGYRVNVMLSGPGGSLAAARTLMQAGSAIVQAGGAGVFIDNSALAHGGSDWISMTEDGGADALNFAFAGIIQGRTEVWTMGMHVLGLRDIVMKRADAEAEGFGIIEVIRYLARGEKPIDHGHILADLNGPRYVAYFEDSPVDRAGSPMHNPFGRLKLMSTKDIAETN